MESDRYREVYLHFSTFVEKWLLRSVCVLLGLLIIVQCMLRIPEIRRFASLVEKLEGQPYNYKIKDGNQRISDP